MKIRLLLITLTAGAVLLAGCRSGAAVSQKLESAVITENDTEETVIDKAADIVPSPQQYKWQTQELTAMISFGVNAYTDREWGDGTESESIFNPVAFDAGQWISTLHDNGFKSVLLICKHHDGFCLWPSAYTEHSVKNSPWKDGKGDIVREVSDACREYGLGFGVYLSPWDRNSRLYGTPEYNDYFVAQLTELLTNYGDVNEVWFDGACGEGPNGKKQVYDLDRWYKLIRKLQPDALIAISGPDIRWVGTESGRGRKTEWSVIPFSSRNAEIVAEKSQKDETVRPIVSIVDEDLGSRDIISKPCLLRWYPAETDVSIRPGWFWHESQNSKVKTPRELMDIYFTSVGMNSVLLLNVPPSSEGLFCAEDIASLEGFTRLREKMYSQDVIKGASARPRSARRTIDHDPDTYWCPEESSCSVTYRLDGMKTFNVLSIQEDIRYGQRVEGFTLKAKDSSGEWKEVASGTTAGYKRLVKFGTVSSDEVCLTITQSRHAPVISEVGLYLDEEQ